MPYIKQAARDALWAGDSPQNAGELNYLFTCMSVLYLDTHGISYQTMNDVIGALDSAKTEFNRRVVAPYEDEKIKENGDVYYVEEEEEPSREGVEL